MPTKPPTFRPKHSQQAKKAYDQQRGSASKRGYGRAWQRYRLWFLREHPMCSAVEGCTKPATDVDHKIPVSSADDEGFWDEGNFQGLCHEHHSAKTREDMRKGLTR